MDIPEGARVILIDERLPAFGICLDPGGRVFYAVVSEATWRPIKIIGNISRINLKTAREAAAKFAEVAKPTIRNPPVFRDPFFLPVPRHRKRKSELKIDAQPAATTPAIPLQQISSTPRRLLTFSELKSKHSIPYSRRHIDRLEAEGKFPKRVPIGAYRVAWVESEIDTFIESRIEQRSEGFGTLGSDTGARRSRRKR